MSRSTNVGRMNRSRSRSRIGNKSRVESSRVQSSRVGIGVGAGVGVSVKENGIIMGISE